MYKPDFEVESLWITALKEGDEKAFERIYNHYWQKLFSVAYNYTRSRETAQEIVQEVFVNLWLHREERTLRSGLQAYLYGAVRNKIYDYFDNKPCGNASRYMLPNSIRLPLIPPNSSLSMMNFSLCLPGR
jgi:hypothetical protein